MCILCVLSRWSRRFVTMLPWLVIPFIITWAFSQLLPPGYRLEVTSTRLACLGVLLSSLGWYELFMPWLSSWRARRSALLRERKLIEAQEAAKWRKEATRKCRNCLTAYKIQAPGGGKFMCTFCGHVSRRPVLEVPCLSRMPVQGLSKACQLGTYSTGQLVNGTGAISLRGCTRVSERRGCIWFGESTDVNEHCRAWKLIIKVLLLISSMFSFLGVIWVKVSGSGKHCGDYSHHSQKMKDEMANTYSSRSEKARKKANERRQARLEKELLEAEERKQREDVARLVEERRRQREEKLHIEKESEREAAAEREREIRRVREIERRRKDKIKDRFREQVEHRTAETASYAESQTRRLEGEESAFVNANILSTSTKFSDSLKASKLSKVRHKQGPKLKCGTDNMTGVFNSYGFNSVLKTGSFVAKNGLSITSKTVGSRKNYDLSGSNSSNSPQNLRLSPKSGIDSAWRNSPWSRSNVWKKGTETVNVKDDNSNMQTAILLQIDEQLNQNVMQGSSIFNNKTVGSNQSLSSVGPIAIQPPIAPSATHPSSLDQLFSAPTIFPPLEPPVDFSNQREQLPQTEVKPSFVPNCTYFDTAACPAFRTCNPVSGLSLPSRPSFCVQSPEGSQLHLRSISDDGEPPHNDIPMQSTCVSESIGSAEINCNPVSPISSCDAASFDVASVSPTFDSMKRCSLDIIDGKGENFIWDFSSIAVEGINNVPHSEQQSLSIGINETKLNECLQLEEHIDRLPFSHISTVQSLFDSEIILPESLSLSPQKEENPSEGYIYHVLKSAVGIWDDTDNLHKVPPEFVDCITQEIMQDPVITADGHSYERSAIEKWLKSHDTSPKTGEVLPPPPGGIGVDKTLRPNHILRGQIIEYKEKLAKMQPKTLSWNTATKDDNFIMTPGSLSVLSF